MVFTPHSELRAPNSNYSALRTRQYSDSIMTEVISCPACNHLLRVPLDWLGQQVQCPECKAMFRAPVREGDTLTAPELISRPAPVASPSAKKPDLMLMLPAFGLMVLGVMGLIVNGYMAYLFLGDPAVGEDLVRKQLPELRKLGFGADVPPEQQAQQDDETAKMVARFLRWFEPVAFAISLMTFLGGLSIVLRWNYRLSQLGCVTAAINPAGLCCVPGAIAGIWGLLMLGSEEGRSHFVK